MNGKTKESNEIPDPVKNIIEMQSGNKKLMEENNYQKQESLFITKNMVSKQSRKIPNWEAPRRDGVQGFWIKKLTNFHEPTAFQLNKILNGNEQLNYWLTYGRTVFRNKKIELKVMLSTHLLFSITVEAFDKHYL